MVSLYTLHFFSYSDSLATLLLIRTKILDRTNSLNRKVCLQFAVLMCTQVDDVEAVGKNPKSTHQEIEWKDPTFPVHIHTKRPVPFFALTARFSWSRRWILSTDFPSHTEIYWAVTNDESPWKRVAGTSPVILLNSADRMAERWGQCLWSDFLQQLPADTCYRFYVSCYLKLCTHTHTKKWKVQFWYKAVRVSNNTCNHKLSPLQNSPWWFC